jgi:hypothetical protein
MCEKTASHPAAATPRSDAGDPARCLGLVLCGALGSGALALVALLGGGGPLAALLAYGLGGSAAVAGMAQFPAGRSRPHRATRVRRIDPRLHRMPS